ncbi:MAG: hypothetical protein L0Z62_46905 [Gemmataceae bacterium]|nr:hypothetical protein [Gemmataceae bacterium]
MTCRGGLRGGLSIRNDIGGTTELPAGRYRVRLLKCWWDEEIGARCIGELLEPAEIAQAMRAGTTGYTAEDYRKFGDEFHERVAEDARAFDPKRVYFALDDFFPDDLEHAA